ncbi:sugar isomerase domain-containing protein [Bailinhaonella thermotolerans]|uniref:Sugar isomerase domain-containing protein n=1 Tax=Bailinhaonella thermotolerans TaxID=1070861 RepID=A0A3A4AY61_9ACTN|nr:sugar isomerase domain-containing protein [Bailinhaonella thermotolerans]RJL32436.1 sugar isomerase domain-containing protein [Bailinhaonella thermotolerans]
MGGFGELMRDRLAAAEAENAAVLDAVAGLLLDRVVRQDGLILAAGAGHSIAMVNEAFYRAGGLACVRPLYRPDLFPLNGAPRSTSGERTPGLAAEVLAEVLAETAGHPHVMVIFSNSGVNPYPVELARHARAAGLPVVAFTSRAAGRSAPRRAGAVLAELADHVVDTLVDPGDAAHPAAAPVTAPLSTLVNAYLWNLLLARLHDLAGDLPLPLWRSANTAGGDEANASLFERYAPEIPALRPGEPA